MKKIILLTVIGALFSLAQCHTVHIQDESKNSFGGPHHSSEQWYMSVLIGIIEIDAPQGTMSRCEHGVAEVRMEETFANGVVNRCVPYLGYIVTFRTNEIYCARPPK